MALYYPKTKINKKGQNKAQHQKPLVSAEALRRYQGVRFQTDSTHTHTHTHTHLQKAIRSGLDARLIHFNCSLLSEDDNNDKRPNDFFS